MARIKTGLDYFPVSTDFMNNRIVRRVMREEGDSGFTIVIFILSNVYSGEGYYVQVDETFIEDVADRLFRTCNDTVRRVIERLVEYGFFDASLYREHAILTSEEIQRLYLFVTKRRNHNSILDKYRLIPQEVKGGASAQMYTESSEMYTESSKMYAESDDIKRKEKKGKETSTLTLLAKEGMRGSKFFKKSCPIASCSACSANRRRKLPEIVCLPPRSAVSLQRQ